jgi:transcriptional regulator with XRE-family HTH domain
MSRSRSRKPKGSTAAQIVGHRVRAIRQARGWSAQQLAYQLSEADPSTVLASRDVIANLENGRRPNITVDEVLLLALVLDSSPTTLFLPNGDVRLQVGPLSLSASRARDWVVGGGPHSPFQMPLPSQDERRFQLNAITHNEPVHVRIVPAQELHQTGRDIARGVAESRSLRTGEPITVPPEWVEWLSSIAAELQQSGDRREYYVED